MSANSSRSPRTPRSSRANKLYRTPPTPPPDVLFKQEKSFVIDSVAVSQMQDDYFHTNPKMAAVIKPYNSQRDKGCGGYFRQTIVDRVLHKTGQDKGGNAIGGIPPERFHEHGYLNTYFKLRNSNGIGHSLENIGGHRASSSGAVPLHGWNGEFGFRRNTPTLRQTPSPFGVQTYRLPLH